MARDTMAGSWVPGCRSVSPCAYLWVHVEVCEHKQQDRLVHHECPVLGSVHVCSGILHTGKPTVERKLVA